MLQNIVITGLYWGVRRFKWKNEIMWGRTGSQSRVNSRWNEDRNRKESGKSCFKIKRPNSCYELSNPRVWGLCHTMGLCVTALVNICYIGLQCEWTASDMTLDFILLGKRSHTTSISLCLFRINYLCHYWWAWIDPVKKCQKYSDMLIRISRFVCFRGRNRLQSLYALIYRLLKISTRLWINSHEISYWNNLWNFETL